VRGTNFLNLEIGELLRPAKDRMTESGELECAPADEPTDGVAAWIKPVTLEPVESEEGRGACSAGKEAKLRWALLLLLSTTPSLLRSDVPALRRESLDIVL
jgi:hypothetical protein